MTIHFTSDTHFGHKRIIELCDRPFNDVTHMNEMIVYNWNSVVAPDDTVYHLGDVALGPIYDSLNYIRRLNGHKVLVVGNHDRMFPPMSKNREDKIASWTQTYKEAGFEWVLESTPVLLFGHEFNLSHFPYEGDSHDGDRYTDYRLEDNGVTLIHGHTHQNQRYSVSKKGTPQVHVGQDAWGFTPVSAERIIDLMEGIG